jgi:hypothetical protein
MKGLKRVLRGVPPSAVLKATLVRRPQLTNGELAIAFVEQFSRVAVLDATHAIWNWKRPDGSREAGLSDEELDQKLFYLLGQAGYAIEPAPISGPLRGA